MAFVFNVSETLLQQNTLVEQKAASLIMLMQKIEWLFVKLKSKHPKEILLHLFVMHHF